MDFVKKIMTYVVIAVCFCLSGLMLITLLVVIADKNNSLNSKLTAGGIIVVIASSLLFVGYLACRKAESLPINKKSKQNKQKNTHTSNDANAKLEGLSIVYLDGLNIASGTNGYVTLTKKELSYQLAGNQYNIAIDKITYIGINTETDIQNVSKQSGTGMIVGAATFGLIGAMVGGRIKNKEKKIHKYFLVVNYESSEGEIKYIVSEALSTANKAVKLVTECRKLGTMKQGQVVNL